ncbi:MAG TPA: hypothetical protein P5555_11870 [Candidatus Paceibacterota bacterium]|nr:hypothetical protein [Verrucomicrobiota bacterium]HRZ45877.1 hypothetical protein [Candidatus Paceibacterota bacterium]
MKAPLFGHGFALVVGCLCCASSLAQEASPKPTVAAAEPTLFQEVTRKLDPGGCLYAYLSTGQWLAGLSAKVAGIRELVLALPNLKGEERANVQAGLKLAENLIAHSGIESVAGAGLSGIAVEKGLYRTRFVLQRTAGAPAGYWGQWFGTKPHVFEGLDWLPANTVWAMFGDLDLGAIWAAVEIEARAAGFEALMTGMAQVSTVVEQATGRSLASQLGSMGGEVGLALILDPNAKFKLPIPGNEQEFPEPALLIGFKVKDDQLFDWIDKSLAENSQSTRGEAQGARWQTLTVPVPLPFPVRPTIGRSGNYLWLASSDRLFEQIRRTRAGDEPSLRSTPEFQRLSRGLPTEGNSFAFMSQQLTDTLVEIQKTAISQAAQGNPGAEIPFQTFQCLMGSAKESAAFAVGWAEAQGMQTVSQGTQEPSVALVSSAVVAPTAAIAGMLLPALTQAKSKAAENSCMSNLRQVALGLLMFSDDNNDVLPKDLLAIKDYIGTPRVLYCPKDPRQPDLTTLTWEGFDLSQCSYEYLTPGKKRRDISSETVTVRCKFHGIEARADGSVRRGSFQRVPID